MKALMKRLETPDLLHRFPDDGTFTQADVGGVFRDTRNAVKAVAGLEHLLLNKK